MAQDDVHHKGKMVESLIVEFDQAKYEEFLSSGSKSPKTRVCRRVSTGNGPEARSVVLSGAPAANCAKQGTRANASQKARVVPGTSAFATNRVAQNTRVSVVRAGKKGGGNGCKDFLESNETITTRLFLPVTREGGC